MKYLTAIWEWLDGKKTNIGAGIGVFIWILSSLNGLLIQTWHLTGIPHIDSINSTLMWISGLFGTTGLVHQYAKYKAAQEEDTPAIQDTVVQEDPHILAYAKANNMSDDYVKSRMLIDAGFKAIVLSQAIN